MRNLRQRCANLTGQECQVFMLCIAWRFKQFLSNFCANAQSQQQSPRGTAYLDYRHFFNAAPYYIFWRVYCTTKKVSFKLAIWEDDVVSRGSYVIISKQPPSWIQHQLDSLIFRIRPELQKATKNELKVIKSVENLRKSLTIFNCVNHSPLCPAWSGYW